MWLQHCTFKIEPTIKTNKRSSKNTNSKDKYFITKAAFDSIELNAHTLTYILLLVLDKQLPIEALNIYLFSSQSCENIFRSARALTGPFSSMTNFTIQQFMKKIRKVSILDDIKSYEQSNDNNYAIKFPSHHKQKQCNSISPVLLEVNEITTAKIEIIINDAYEYAKTFINKLEMSRILKENDAYELEDLCLNIHSRLQNSMRTVDRSTLESDDDLDNDSDNNSYNTDTESSDSGEVSGEQNELDSEEEYEDEQLEGIQPSIASTTENFRGMRIYDEIDNKRQGTYFKIKINNKDKYIHKQTAAWYLTTNNNQLSSDRLIRVQRMNKQK
ncbi:unnamed protein product [Didymodactylos carnosus]|uniref:Uncharacterized protein n=1 Tax=Didymodactylos carnosus TaxID=1234261 RepID=A0A816BX61_9BILA|nr:unnamed protein product [Didymodactylos carnosus]CAF4497640.1 unnamed protein product [Didymodactylos carnosus]